ncbi:MAG: TetR/AcrR family transcriptional regulator [Xanthomonadaceae bacterium]|nr:TetR/AcrR family transcriptional regulator [Xanthomonadaceae bacterium]
MPSRTTPAKPRRRRVGRPAGDDGDLRGRLLDVAAAQFASTGIAAASLRTIAQAAGVTPAMLHYYFGNKDALVRALIDERLLPHVRPLVEMLAASGETPLELAQAFARGVSGIVATLPWLPALWVREVLCEGGALREFVFRDVMPSLPQVLARRFEAARAAGQLAPGIDPRLMVVSLVGLTLFPAAGAPIWQQAFGMPGLDMPALMSHTLALLGHGLAAPSTETPR